MSASTIELQFTDDLTPLAAFSTTCCMAYLLSMLVFTPRACARGKVIGRVVVVVVVVVVSTKIAIS